jgi:sulfite reductase (NADPH) hemoprotein beta-component
MVGGGVDANGASFGRLMAKIPARRGPEAVDRLARLYAAERSPDESAKSFFTRVDATRVKLLLHDLEQLTTETATTDDFIDLAESKEFAPETMEGECAT